MVQALELGHNMEEYALEQKEGVPSHGDIFVVNEQPKRDLATPVGPLAGVLAYHNAPEEAKARIARRVGHIVGTEMLPLETLDKVIESSKRINHGTPDWTSVGTVVGVMARDAYKKTRRGV